MKVPAPLESGELCADCKGTGANIAATLARPDYDSGYVMCRTCNGNGLDPAEYFTWSADKTKGVER